MSTVSMNTKIEVAHSFAKSLATNARSDVKAKILAFDDACRRILLSGGKVSIASVRAWLATNSGISISPKTLMNKAPDRITKELLYSPMRRVLDAYRDILPHRIEISSEVEEGLSGYDMIVTQDELLSIGDVQLRYKVGLLNSRLRNAQNHLHYYRQCVLPTDAPESINSGGAFSLSPAEEDAIRSMLNERELGRRRAHFDEEGRLVVIAPASQKRTEIIISTPFLKQALVAISEAQS